MLNMKLILFSLLSRSGWCAPLFASIMKCKHAQCVRLAAAGRCVWLGVALQLCTLDGLDCCVSLASLTKTILISQHSNNL